MVNTEENSQLLTPSHSTAKPLITSSHAMELKKTHTGFFFLIIWRGKLDKHKCNRFSYRLTQPLFKTLSLELLKNSNTLSKAVIWNQAITENQCSFHSKGLMRSWIVLELQQKQHFPFPHSPVRKITLIVVGNQSINTFNEKACLGRRYFS